MSTQKYYAVLDGADGSWGVRVPSMPGCYGGGATAAEAEADAASAAREWLAHRFARGTRPPAPERPRDMPAAGPGESVIELEVELPCFRSGRRTPQQAPGQAVVEGGRCYLTEAMAAQIRAHPEVTTVRAGADHPGRYMGIELILDEELLDREPGA